MEKNVKIMILHEDSSLDLFVFEKDLITGNMHTSINIYVFVDTHKTF